MSLKKIYYYVFILSCFSILFLSCQSNKISNTIVNGLIYDSNNEPVPNAIIKLNEAEVTTSDIYGHFELSNLVPNKSYVIKVSKPEYNDVSIKFEYTSVSQVIYIKIDSYKYLLSQAENYVSERKYTQALEVLNNVDTIVKDNLSSKYLRATIFYLTKDYENCINLLHELEQNEIQPSIYLLLADCYQYGLYMQDQAKYYLKKYLEYDYNAKIEERFLAL